MSLSGVASKGRTANAEVKVYAVKADGTVDESTALASDRVPLLERHQRDPMPAPRKRQVMASQVSRLRIDPG